MNDGFFFSPVYHLSTTLREGELQTKVGEERSEVGEVKGERERREGGGLSGPVVTLR